VVRAAFEAHLGPLKRIITRNVSEREEIEREKSIQFSELRMLSTVGMGTFGRVRLVEHTGSGKTYALKSMSKEKIIRYQQEQHVRNECLLMRKISHPFCGRLITTFKDDLRVHMLLEATMGGELFRYLDLEPSGSFPELWCAFYSGCVLLALDHLHSQDIVYRDLKPENLLLDKFGYLKVVDYGFAKHVSKRTYTVCGTPDYIAPEIILRKGGDGLMAALHIPHPTPHTWHPTL
jgi:serine/threonine protein kinase